MSQRELDHHLYNAILLAWLERPSVKWVSEQLEVSPALVKRLVRDGAPEIGKGPLPPAQRKSKSDKVGKPKKEVTLDPQVVAARTVVAKQEMGEKVRAVRARLEEAERAAAEVSEQAKEAEFEQQMDGTLRELELAKKRVDREEKRIAVVEQRAIVADNVSRAANEAAAAAMVMDHVMTIGAIMQHLTVKLLQGIEAGEIEMPKTVSPKMLGSLTNSADRLTSAVERAIKIQKGKSGEPDKVLGVQIGILLDGCTPEELEMVAETGQLPQRLRLVAGGD